MRSSFTELGTALIIITNNLGVVARYAMRGWSCTVGKIIETGNSQDIYHDPRHPYTIGLLRSVPPGRSRL